MTSRISSTALAELTPLLGSLARLLADDTPLGDELMHVLLVGADLEADPAALAELQRWSRLLTRLRDQPTPELRRGTLEALVLRGLPEAPVLLALTTITERATNPTASSVPAQKRLQVSVERLDFGVLPPNHTATVGFEIQGGPGQIVVESDYVRVTPTQFGAGPTQVRVEILPLSEGLLWTALKLVTAGETVEVPVMAQWDVNASPPVGTSSVVGTLTAAPKIVQPTANPIKHAGIAIVVAPMQDRAEAGAQLLQVIGAAPAGAMIQIKAGDYVLATPLVLDRPLTLQGEGNDRTRLCCAAEECVVRFVGAGPFVAADLSFVHVGVAWAHVGEVLNGSIDFHNCRFTGGVGDEASGRGGNGLCLRGQTRGNVAHCEVSHNGLDGIVVGDQAQPTLASNLCHENAEAGIVYLGSATGTARQNSCHKNGSHGMVIAYRAQPILEGNSCCENKQAGIWYRDNAAGIARQNICDRNGTVGFYVSYETQPTLEANTCCENAESGMFYFGSAVGIVRQNTCMKNGACGIRVGHKASPRLLTNICQENAKSGIAYLDSAGGTIQGNQCLKNGGDGIYIHSTARPTLTDNRCEGNHGQSVNDRRRWWKPW